MDWSHPPLLYATLNGQKSGPYMPSHIELKGPKKAPIQVVLMWMIGPVDSNTMMTSVNLDWNGSNFSGGEVTAQVVTGDTINVTWEVTLA